MGRKTRGAERPPRPEDFGIGRLFWDIQEAVVIGEAVSGRIVLFNPAAERLFGSSAAEVVGRPLAVLIPEQFRAQHRAGLVRYRATGHGPIVDGRRPVEVTALRGDGNEVAIELTLSPIAEPAVEGSFVLAILRDISARREAEEARARLHQEQAALRARDQFLSLAAHELKTPVASLRIAAQMLARQIERQGSVSPEVVLASAQTLDRQTAKLTALIEQLLDLSRLQAGRLELRRGPSNVAALVRGAVETGRRLEPGRAILVEAPTEIRATVDAIRLEQVLTNLLDNARKFSPPESRIDLAVSQPEPGWVRIAVRDRGPGIPPEERERIFEPYHQLAADAAYEGMGLGLYASCQIVQLHGGSIVVESPPDGGSCFVVRLPTGL